MVGVRARFWVNDTFSFMGWGMARFNVKIWFSVGVSIFVMIRVRVKF